MPVTRSISVEEDITMSIGTTITGLVAKHSTKVNPKAIAESILGNTCICLNELIERSPLDVVERNIMRTSLKQLVERAFAPKLVSVQPAGG